MKSLRAIRIIASTLFLAASVAYLFVGQRFPALSIYSVRMQIIPSAIASCVGITLFWLAITLLLGRVYCSSVCPVGTLLDAAATMRPRVFSRGRRASYRYHSPFRRRYDILVVYLICLIVGLIAVPLLIEPWNIFCNIVATVHPAALPAQWARLGIGAAAGIAGGAVSLILILGAGLLFGRDFCNAVCPIGMALGLLHSRTIYHIEIDPDRCSGCLACEERCKASCIKVVSRYVDNSRCVRCFNCLDACPDDAIHYQPNRNRRATPLMRKVKQPQS